MRHVLPLIIEISAFLFKRFVKQWEIFINPIFGHRRKFFLHSTIDAFYHWLFYYWHAVSKFYANVIASLESNLIRLAVFLDLSKAFDTFDTFLWCSWRCFGVVQELFDKQVPICVIPSHSLYQYSVACGVPQGSVLGQLLSKWFTTCINTFNMHLICRQYNNILYFSKPKRITTKYRKWQTGFMQTNCHWMFRRQLCCVFSKEHKQ